MFLYLESTQSPQIYPENKPNSFTIRLPEPYIRTGRGYWVLGLIQISIPSFVKPDDHPKWDFLYVTCDACKGTPLGGTYAPLLHAVSCTQIKRFNHQEFASVLHIPLRLTSVSELTIEIRDSEWNLVHLAEATKGKRTSTKCVLELRWKKDTDP
jgi:hypothetical protein